MEIDLDRRELYMPKKHLKKDRCIDLTPHECSLLKIMLSNKGKVASYEDIGKEVYGNDSINEFDRANIRMLVHRLKKKGVNILTLSKFGYKLGGN